MNDEIYECPNCEAVWHVSETSACTCFSPAPKPSETEGVRPKEYFGVHLPNKQFLMLLSGPHETEATLHLIEKSAYDKLQAEHRADLKTAIEREYKLQQELSSARREVEEWRQHHSDTLAELNRGHDEMKTRLTQEQARSAELLETLETIVMCGFCEECTKVARKIISKHNSVKGG